MGFGDTDVICPCRINAINPYLPERLERFIPRYQHAQSLVTPVLV